MKILMRSRGIDQILFSWCLIYVVLVLIGSVIIVTGQETTTPTSETASQQVHFDYITQDGRKVTINMDKTDDAEQLRIEIEEICHAMIEGKYLLPSNPDDNTLFLRCFRKVNNLYYNFNNDIIKIFQLPVNSLGVIFTWIIRNVSNITEWEEELKLGIETEKEYLFLQNKDISLESIQRDLIDNFPIVFDNQLTFNNDLIMPAVQPIEVIFPETKNLFKSAPENVLLGPYFDEQKGLIRSRIWAKELSHAMPFEHAVLDNFIHEDILRKIVVEYDEVIQRKHTSFIPGRFISFQDQVQYKTGMNNYYSYGFYTKQLLNELKSKRFIRILERITGITGLIPDPTDKGGGMHIIDPNGYLHVHLDFPFHTSLHLWRRVNVLLYLNDDDWQSDWNGNLELWTKANSTRFSSSATETKTTTMTATRESVLSSTPASYLMKDADISINSSDLVFGKEVVPLFNRMVILKLSDRSYHGHPRSLACPPNKKRKSLALYYYTSDIAPDKSLLFKTTAFVPTQRPGLV